MREVWPSNLPLFFRISAVDGPAGGWSLDDSVALASELAACGVDVVDCSAGGISGPPHFRADDGGKPLPKGGERLPGFQVPYAERLRRDAKLLEEAGCFALVLEKIPAKLAEEVAKSVSIPVIGIGAGGGVDGQVLVMHDMLGINKEFNPRFLRRYADLYTVITGAVEQYVKDVRSSDFPNKDEQY